MDKVQRQKISSPGNILTSEPNRVVSKISAHPTQHVICDRGIAVPRRGSNPSLISQ